MKDRLKYDFDGLDMLKKGKAVMACAVNLKTISKIPAFIQQTLDNCKSEYEELKEAIDDLKKNMP